MKINDNLYNWMIKNISYHIMYKYTKIDNIHWMWLPRWGYSKKQMKDAENYANELLDKIKFE